MMSPFRYVMFDVWMFWKVLNAYWIFSSIAPKCFYHSTFTTTPPRSNEWTGNNFYPPQAI